MTTHAIDIGSATLELKGDQLLRIESDGKYVLRCLEGRLWITQHLDSNDLVLKVGETCMLDRIGPAVVSAIRSCRFAIRRGDERQQTKRSRWAAAFAV